MPDDKVETPSDKRRPEDPDVEITRLVKRPAADEIVPPARPRPVMAPPVRRARTAEPEHPAPREPAGGLAPEDLEPTRAMPRRAESAAPVAREQGERTSGPAAPATPAGAAPVAPPPRVSPFDRRIPHLEISTPDNEETRFVPRAFGEATGAAREADTADERPTAVMPRRRVPAPPFPPRGVTMLAEPDEAADLRPTRAVGPGGVATRIVLPAEPPVAGEAEAAAAPVLAPAEQSVSAEPVLAEPMSADPAPVAATPVEAAPAPVEPASTEAAQAAPAEPEPMHGEPQAEGIAPAAMAVSPAPASEAPVTPEPSGPEMKPEAALEAAPEAALEPISPPEPREPEPNPVVAWLVVTKGPGRGAFRALGPGRNNLGSSEAATVRLDFGDPAIAPSGHAYIVYDDETRGFVIEDGKRKELVRVNDRLLSDARDLADRDEIRIGATTLVFVAFCGPGFDWGAAG